MHSDCCHFYRRVAHFESKIFGSQADSSSKNSSLFSK